MPDPKKTTIMLAMVNDQIVDPEKPQISMHDRALYFGDGAYEVVQSYCGKLWGLEPHLKRFQRSLNEIDIENVNIDDVRKKINHAFDAVNHADCVIYWHITRGAEERTHVPGDNLAPQFLLLVKFPPDNTEKRRTGIAAVTYPEIRWKRCDIKSLNLLPNVMARNYAKKHNAQEALFVDNNILVEGAATTLYFVIDNKIVTHPLGHAVLPGVIRSAIAAIAKKLNIEFIERPVTLNEALEKASELFISSSSEEIRALVSLDGKAIADGKPGPIVNKINEVFVNHTRSGRSFEDLVAALPKA